MEKCHDTLGAVKDTLVLSVELTDDILKDSPQTIVRILESSEVQAAIKKALTEEGKRLAEKQRTGGEVSADDSKLFLSTVGGAVSAAALVAAKKQVEGTQAYKDVKASVENLACSFRNSPMGVYIDEHKKLLIIVASGLAIGGVVSMYKLQTGDWPAAQLSRLANQIVQFKPLGNVTLGAKGIKFVPSNRTVEATVFSEVNWNAVKHNLEIKVGFQDDRLMHASGKTAFIVPLRTELSLTGQASAGYQTLDTGGTQTNYGLGLGLKYSTKTVDAGLTVEFLSTSIDADGQRRQTPELKGNLGVTVRFD